MFCSDNGIIRWNPQYIGNFHTHMTNGIINKIHYELGIKRLTVLKITSNFDYLNDKHVKYSTTYKGSKYYFFENVIKLRHIYNSNTHTTYCSICKKYILPEIIPSSECNKCIKVVNEQFYILTRLWWFSGYIDIISDIQTNIKEMIVLFI
jgi:hypothetical protein